MIKSLGQLVIIVFVFVILIPALVVGLCSMGGRLSVPSHPGEKPPPLTPDPPSSQGTAVSVYGMEGPHTTELPLEKYLVGVVAAEMPANFHLEALKAQAVVARTYSLHKIEGLSSTCPRHEEAHLCTDSTCCQAWEDPQDFYNNLPEKERDELYQKVIEAVNKTENKVLVYQGELIEAVYHSTCGGTTEASHVLWDGNPLPYLQPVECSYCAHSPYYRQEVIVAQEKLEAAFPRENILPVAGTPGISGISVKERGPGHRVVSMQVGSQLYSGPEVRRKLDLPSTFFSLEAQSDHLVFDIRGHGHGVGLCQYGADGMAVSGSSYEEILAHYFPRAELQQ